MSQFGQGAGKGGSWWSRWWSWPLRTARRLFQPRRVDYLDIAPGERWYPLIAGMSTVRQVAGYGVWVALRLAGQLSIYPNQQLTLRDWLSITAPIWISPIMVFVVALGLYVATRPKKRLFTFKSLLTPLICSLAFLAFYVIWSGITLWASSAGTGERQVVPDATASTAENLTFLFLDIPLGIVAVILIAWIFWTGGCFFVRCYWNQFRVIDGHPYLGALSALASTWLVIAYGFTAGGLTLQVRPDASPGLRFATVWGGPLLITALAAIEIAYLWLVLERSPRDGSAPSIPDPA